MDTSNLLPKPPVGQPCNRCGRCCMKQICTYGAFVMAYTAYPYSQVEGQCPALVGKRDGTFECGIVLDPRKYFPACDYSDKELSAISMLLIFAAKGCDLLGDNPDPEEEKNKLDLCNAVHEDEPFQQEAAKAYEIIYGILFKETVGGFLLRKDGSIPIQWSAPGDNDNTV